jgi:hypothetical protein
LSILDLFLSNEAADNTAIFDNGQRVFAEAKIISIAIKPSSKLMEHPLESGALQSDHKVINPIEIEIKFIVPRNRYQNVVPLLRQTFIESRFLTIQTRHVIFNNMVITELPWEETAQMSDAIAVSIKFKEVILAVTTTTFAPEDEKKTNVKKVGEKKPKEIAGSDKLSLSDRLAVQFGGHAYK